MRIGARKRPFYRIIVVDERNKRNGAYLDLLGTYDPLSEPKDIKIDKQKLEDWLKKGAQKSDGLLRILKEAPQRHRKPKKEVLIKEAPKEEVAAPVAEPETVAEEAPSEAQPEEPKIEEVAEAIKTEETKEETA